MPNDITVDGNFVFFWRGWPGQWFRSYFTDENGVNYSHAEQYMMAEKARLFGDLATLGKILAAQKPREQKDLGRQIAPYDEAVWTAARQDAVYRGNVLKFSQNADLKKLLLETGTRILVEASPEDRIWGIGLSVDDPRSRDIQTWQGQNLLGIALMRVRYHLETGQDGRSIKVY